MPVLAAFKDSDTSRSLTETPVIDPDLQVSVVAADYTIKAFLILGHAGAGGGDFRFQISNGTGYLSFVGLDNIGEYGRARQAFTSTTFLDFQTSTTGRACIVRGEVGISSAGTFGIEWAQSNSSANASILKEGSWLKLVEL